jgi:hypothetical protein
MVANEHDAAVAVLELGYFADELFNHATLSSGSPGSLIVEP